MPRSGSGAADGGAGGVGRDVKRCILGLRSAYVFRHDADMPKDTVHITFSIPHKVRVAIDRMKDAAGLTRSDFLKQCAFEAGPRIVKRMQQMQGEEVKS